MCNAFFDYHFLDKKQYIILGVALHSRLFHAYTAYQHGATGSWTGSVLDRRNHADDFLSDEDLRDLDKQLQHRDVQQQKDDLATHNAHGQVAQSEHSFFAQCRQFFMRIIAALRGQ